MTTTLTSPAEQEPTKAPKTNRITLSASGARLTLLAVKRPDGAGTTFVITVDATTKKSSRGMTERHATFEAAKQHLAKLALDAEKVGWVRAKRVGFTAKPDAFSTLPAAPRAAKSGKK